MDTKEIRELAVDKIQDELDDAREALMRLRFQKASGELKDQNLLGGTRRKIARLLTILNEKGGPLPATDKKAEQPEKKAEKKAKAEKNAKSEKKAEQPVKKVEKKKKAEKKTEGEA